MTSEYDIKRVVKRKRLDLNFDDAIFFAIPLLLMLFAVGVVGFSIYEGRKDVSVIKESLR